MATGHWPAFKEKNEKKKHIYKNIKISSYSSFIFTPRFLYWT
jgi:hypothetical protein